METTHESALTSRVIGCATEVHHHLGPGLLESIYENALCHELTQAGIGFNREYLVSIRYKGHDVGCDVVLDLVVEGSLVVDIQAVPRIHPIHETRLQTYLWVSGLPLGMLMNFNAARLKDGIRHRRL